MPRQELNSGDVKIDQKPDLDPDLYDGEIVLVDKDVRQAVDKELGQALLFADEPVTIRLQPSAEKNAPTTFPVWVNGKGAEMYINGRWTEVAWLPIGPEITIKRKYLEVIARAKADQVETVGTTPEDTRNQIRRTTYGVHSFTVIRDTDKGHAWMTELLRRNF